MVSVLYSDVLPRFIGWAEVNLAARTVAVYRHYLGRFLAQVGDVELSAITPAMLTTWSTKFHPIQAVQRLVSWAVKVERSLPTNPLAGMEKPATGRRKRTFNRRAAAAILRAADRRARLLLTTMRESGMRPQEARAVEWGDLLTLDGDPWSDEELVAGVAYFVLPEGKGFRRRKDRDAVRVVPISPRLGRLLVRLKRNSESAGGPIFRNRLRRPWTANGLRCRMRTLRTVAGLGPDRRGERVVAYTWRHTAATIAARAGVRDFRLAELLGHASTRTTARYVHLNAGDLVDAAKQVWESKKRRDDENRPPRIA